MSKNRTGGLNGNLEWGNKARKREDAQRGRNNQARRAAIADQVESHNHVWRYSNGRDWFYCTVTGCTATESAD